MPATVTQQVLAPAAMMHGTHYPGPVPMGPMHPGTPRLLFAHPSVAGMQQGSSDQVLSGPRLGQTAPYMPGGPAPGIISSGPAMMFNIPGHPTSHPPPTGMAAGAPAYVMPPPGSLPVQFASPGPRAQMMPGPQPGQEGFSVGGTTYYGAAPMMPSPDVIAPGAQYYGDGAPAGTKHSNIVYYLPSAQQANRTPPRRQKTAIPIMRPEDVGFAQAGGEGLAVGLEGTDRLAASVGPGHSFESNHPAGEPCYLPPEVVPGYESGAGHPSVIKTAAAVHSDQSGRPPDVAELELRVSAVALGPAEGAASLPVAEAAGQSS